MKSFEGAPAWAIGFISHKICTCLVGRPDRWHGCRAHARSLGTDWITKVEGKASQISPILSVMSKILPGKLRENRSQLCGGVVAKPFALLCTERPVRRLVGSRPYWNSGIDQSGKRKNRKWYIEESGRVLILPPFLLTATARNAGPWVVILMWHWEAQASFMGTFTRNWGQPTQLDGTTIFLSLWFCGCFRTISLLPSRTPNKRVRRLRERGLFNATFGHIYLDIRVLLSVINFFPPVRKSPHDSSRVGKKQDLGTVAVVG